MNGTERGAVAPLMAVAVLMMGGLTVGLGQLGRATLERAQAQSAADAAALAGAAEGRPAATALAEANGGVLTSFDSEAATVRVTVRLGSAVAAAKAARSVAERPSR